MKRSAVLFLAGFFAATLFAAPAVDRTLQYDFLIGTNQHYAFNEGPVDETLSLMKQAGFNTWRSNLRWPAWQRGNTFQRPKNIFLAAKTSAQMGMIPIINFHESNKVIGGHYPVGPYRQPFIDFCCRAVKEMEGTTPILQLWNEWDGGSMMSVDVAKDHTPEKYVALIKAAAPQIRKAAPDAILVSNPFCSVNTTRKAFQLGMLDYCDAFSAHVYGYGGTPEEARERIAALASLSAQYNHGVPKPFYITEAGWSSIPGGVSDKTQGDYAARLYLLAKTVPACRGVTWYNTQERGYDPDKESLYLGVMTYDYTPKEAFMAMSSVAPVVRNGTFVKRIPASDPNIWLMLYRLKDGRHVLAAWYTNPRHRAQIVLHRNGSPTGELTFEVCGGKPYRRRWGFLEQHAHNGGPNQFKEDPELFSFFCTSRPVLLYGVPANVKVARSLVRLHYEPVPQTARGPRAFLQINSRTGLNLQIAGDKAYRQLLNDDPHRGDQDLSCTARITGDQRELQVEVRVTDDKFCPLLQGGRLEEGDSVQFGIYAMKEDGLYGKEFHEYLLAADHKGSAHLVKRYGKNANAPTSAKLAVKRLSKTELSYTFTVPWRELNAQTTPLFNGKVPLLFSILVNDNDGQGRKGYLHWGDGITEKNSTLFGHLSWGREAAAAAPLKPGENAELLGTPARKDGWKLASTSSNWEATWYETTLAGRPALFLEGYFPLTLGQNNVCVSITRPVVQKVPGFFRGLRIEVYSLTENYLTVKLVDATGQTFVHFVPIPSKGIWHTVECSFDPRKRHPIKGMPCWGGAKDKLFHAPLQEVSLILDWSFRQPGAVYGTLGRIAFGKVELVTGK